MSSSSRIVAIDQFRGFAILLMVLANYLAGVHSVPAWLKHAPDIGLTVADLIAPFFIFAIGLTYGLSARRRMQAAGKAKTVQHFLVRFFALIGIGSLISAGEILFEIDHVTVNWGVLQAIGVAGLVSLPVIGWSCRRRLGVGLALLAGYQILLDHGWRAKVLALPHGGLYGALGWAAMLILATVLADGFHGEQPGRARFVWQAALTLAFGLLLAAWVPVSKNRISASYVLVSLGASGVLFSGFAWWAQRCQRRLELLAAWGENPLLLYVLHFFLLALVVLPGVPRWYPEAPVWLVAVQATALIAGLSLVAWALHRKQWTFSL